MSYYDKERRANPQTVNPDTRENEDAFRAKVRDVLGLAWDARDSKIFDELKRLKALDDAYEATRREWALPPSEPRMRLDHADTAAFVDPVLDPRD